MNASLEESSKENKDVENTGFFRKMQNQFRHSEGLFPSFLNYIAKGRKLKKFDCALHESNNASDASSALDGLESQLQNFDLQREEMDATEENANETAQNIPFWQGWQGNGMAAQNVLDSLEPFCNNQEELYSSLMNAGGQEIGFEEYDSQEELQLSHDIDGIVVMSKNLDFFKFEHKKYQMQANGKLKNVTSLTRKCRDRIFDPEQSGGDNIISLKQEVWATRLFNECPVQVFFYTIPDEEERQEMANVHPGLAGRYTNRQPGWGCYQLVKQVLEQIIRELYAEHEASNHECQLNNVPTFDLPRSLHSGLVQVATNTNTHIVSTPTLDIFGEDIDAIAAKFQQVLEQKLLTENRPFYAVRFGILEMGTKILEEVSIEEGPQKMFNNPTSVFHSVLLSKLGQDGFVSIHFASSLRSADGHHLFPKNIDHVHGGQHLVNEYGLEQKCQKFPIMGRKDIANYHCNVHQNDQWTTNFVTDCSSTTAVMKSSGLQIYSDSSHMFTSRTNQTGSFISENVHAKNVLPKYYKGGGGGNRCPFIDFPILRYLLGMLQGKELTDINNLVQIRQCLQYVHLLRQTSCRVRVECVVNARFHDRYRRIVIDDDGEEDVQARSQYLTLGDFVNAQEVYGVSDRKVHNLIEEGYIVKILKGNWERYVLKILAPLLSTLLRCILDHRQGTINLGAVKLARMVETVLNFLFVGNPNYCGDPKILRLAGCSRKGMDNLIGNMAVVDMNVPVEERLQHFYLSLGKVPFQAGHIANYKYLFFLCFPGMIENVLHSSEIGDRYARAALNALSLYQRLLDQSNKYSPVSAVQLLIVCLFGYIWRVKSAYYAAQSFKVLDPDENALYLANVPFERACTTQEHVISLIYQWLKTSAAIPLRQFEIVLSRYLREVHNMVFTADLLREVVRGMHINQFFICQFSPFDSLHLDPRDLRRVIQVYGSDVIEEMLKYGYKKIPMTVIDAFWQFLLGKVQEAYNIQQYAVQRMPKVHEDSPVGSELRQWLSQILYALLQAFNHSSSNEGLGFA